MAQRVGKGIALLFHDRNTRRGGVVTSTPRSYFTSGKEQVTIVQEAGWAPGPIWTGGRSRPTGIRYPDRPVRSSVAIPTEIPGPHWYKYSTHISVLETRKKIHYFLAERVGTSEAVISEFCELIKECVRTSQNKRSILG